MLIEKYLQIKVIDFGQRNLTLKIKDLRFFILNAKVIATQKKIGFVKMNVLGKNLHSVGCGHTSQ